MIFIVVYSIGFISIYIYETMIALVSVSYFSSGELSFALLSKTCQVASIVLNLTIGVFRYYM